MLTGFSHLLALTDLLSLFWGLITFAWGIFAFIFLPDSPATARYFTARERYVVRKTSVSDLTSSDNNA